MTLIEHVAKRIRELRLEQANGAGLSQERLAAALNVATNTISRWETGTYRPSIEDLENLARFFGISVMEFFPSEKSASPTENEQVMQLLRVTKGLMPEDIEELQRYAEFRRARHRLAQAKGPNAQRRAKPK